MNDKVGKNATREPSLERVLREASMKLLGHTGGAPDDLATRCARIVQAVWLAASRGEGEALREPDGWADLYLDTQGDNERFTNVTLLTRRGAMKQLCITAEKWVKPLRSASPSQREKAPSVIAQMMVSEVSRSAPFVCTLSYLMPRNQERYERARETLTRKIGAAIQESEDMGLDAVRLVRMTLDAFDVPRDQIKNWLRFLGQRAKRAQRRRSTVGNK
jgi:hypothetical protein